MHSFECPMCGTEGIVKEWQFLHSGSRAAWCFCPKCKYKFHSKEISKEPSQEMLKLAWCLDKTEERAKEMEETGGLYSAGLRDAKKLMESAFYEELGK